MTGKLTKVHPGHAYAPTTESGEPTSPTLRDGMPHVFVIPPEEEQLHTPPWCCFDANEQNDPDYDDADYDEHPSDSQFIDVALDYIHDVEENAEITPVFRRVSLEEATQEVVLSRKAEKRSSSVLSFISYRNEGEGRQHGARELPEDVIEVVKVRRNEGKAVDATTGPAPKRSKTMKMPFQKAFRSIKNVGKGTSRPKHHAKDVLSSSQGTPQAQPQEEIAPSSRATSPMLTRQGSRRLSQFFSRSNHSNADLVLATTEPTIVTTSNTDSSTLSNIEHTPETSPLVDELGVNVEPTQSERPLSPTLSSNRSSRRFSVLDLHRLFTFSSSPSIPTEDQDQNLNSRTSQDAPTLPTRSSHTPSSIPSTTTTSTSSEYAYPALISTDAYSVDKIGGGDRWRTSNEIRRSVDEPEGVPGDLRFEMKLDSLHFDSLSFDPEEFDVSLAMDGRRR